MKFKITFKVKEKGQLLPMSYQYELSSWIYKLIYRGDKEFANFLHSQGYKEKNKKFKLFTFSRLSISKYDQIDDRMKILCDNISFVVSFLVDNTAEQLILGLFQDQDLILGDRITQVNLSVKAVEAQELKVLSNRVKLKTTSPLMVGKPEIRANGKFIHKYLNPLDRDFEYYFFKNLTDKYQAARANNLIPALKNETPLRFKLISEKPKPQGVRIKAHTKSETKVIGYAFEFELEAPIEMIKLGILAGFGGENALGFGATKLLNN